MEFEPSEKLIKLVREYNRLLEKIAEDILSLKLESLNDMNIFYLHNLMDKMSVINSVAKRKKVENSLDEIILEYGYILQKLVHPEDDDWENKYERWCFKY